MAGCQFRNVMTLNAGNALTPDMLVMLAGKVIIVLVRRVRLAPFMA